MSMKPTPSLSTIGNLSDVLKDLPLASPIDYNVDEDLNLTNLSIFDTQQKVEPTLKLLNSNDPYLVDVLNRSLSQIDTSKIQLKPSCENSSNSRLNFPPLLQTILMFNPKLFNGSLNEQLHVQQQKNNHTQINSSNHFEQQMQQSASINQNVASNGMSNQAQQQQQQQSSSSNSQKNHHLASNSLSGASGSSASPSSSSSLTGTTNKDHFVMPNDDTIKSSMKVSKNTTNKDNSEIIGTNKFYSSKPQQQNQEIKKEKNSSNSTVTPKKEKSSNNLSKKPSEHNRGSQLGNWQADLTSQLLLPPDFTPELISQLAAEGYDVTSAGGRKARTKSNQPQSSLAKTLIDSSDEENDDEYNPNKSESKQYSNTNQNNNSSSKLNNNTMNKNRFERINMGQIDLQDPTDHPSYKRFNQILDDLLDSYEEDLQEIKYGNKIGKKSSSKTNKRRDDDGTEDGTSSSDDEIPSEYLLSRQICSDLMQESFRLNSLSIMNTIRKDNLNKLQNLLYFNIKDSRQSVKLLNEENSGSSEQDKLFREILIEKILKASDCSIISLTIMTSPKISKELIVEDIIEQIAIFIKVNLTEIVFPHYDSVYKTIKHESVATKSNKTKRKLDNQFSNSGGSSSSSGGSGGLLGKPKNMQNFYNGMREILSLIAELVCQIDLTDTIIITLTSVTVMCFFVENISDLQLISLRILTNIFTRYSKHRQLVFDDILSSLIKLHPTKRNSRTYKCFNGDSIQMFSALLLQLIQCEVNIIENFQHKSQLVLLGTDVNLDNDQKANELTFEEKESYLMNAYEDSSQTAKKFLSVFFSKCKTKQADFDFRPIFENFIQDLLTTVNKPEWPVSEIILNLLGIILVNQIQNEQNDVGSRVNSLEYLGQIVSQLRKDSLDYQKNADKIINVLKKINKSIQSKENSTEELEEKGQINLDNLNFSNSDILNFQISLIMYLDSLAANDSSLKYSKYFLVGQWLKELNTSVANANQDHDQDRIKTHSLIEENRKKLYSLIEKESKDLKISELNTNDQLDMNEASILTKYLCSLKKTLDKSFDYYLTTILRLSGGGSELNTPTQVRSKAIKCLSLIIEADPRILLKEKVFACVKSNFLHQTISVREASVDLIGRFITLKPELTSFYFQLLSERILDVGVSVRKRTIKIFRDICINQPDFEHMSEICVKILRRINDEDGIKKLVIDMFYSIWFSPINSSNKDQLMRRVLSIVDVVSEFNAISSNASLEIFEQLFNALVSTSNLNSGQQHQLQNGNNDENINGTSNNGSSGITTNEQELHLQKVKEVFKSCKQIVNCLIENVLNTENTSTGSAQAYKRLVASFSTLYLLSKIKPDNFINHAETLLPYLNIKSTNQNDNQIINSAAKILECVIPLLQSPSNSFLISLEESLCKLILNSGMMIVSSCISCLGTVVNKLTKNYKLAADCFLRFFKLYNNLKRAINLAKPIEPNARPHIFRMLFTLGLLSKNFDVEAEEFSEYKICSKEDLFEMYMFFIRSTDIDVQQKTLIGLGSFLTRYSEYMINDDIKKLYLNYIKSPSVPYLLKSQIFLNLTDYLNEEDQKNLAKSVELSKNHGSKDDLKEMLDVQSGMASTIIQSYLKPILDSYLSPNTNLRMNVFNCLSMILNQGLVYPIECVPYLIAMTTDEDKKIQARALVHLTNLQKAHPGFVQSKSIAGVNVSFLLQKIIVKNQKKQITDATPNESDTHSDLVIRGYSEQGEILSMNHHLYTLLRINRSYRRAFSQQLLKMFDDSYFHKTSLAHMLYISDNLAYFPYQLMDEPLYLIHQIDIIISVTGINLLQTFKESLLNHRNNSEKIESNQNNINLVNSDENNQLTDVDVNQDCPIDIDEIDEQNKETIKSQSSFNASQKKTLDDDEDETFEVVYNNLPQDLKVLKDCMYKAQGCCLLLILKFFFKEIYSISDSKIQNYSPTDTAKVNDRPITSRKTNRKFNPKSIIEYMIKNELKKQQNDEDDNELRANLVKEYLEFKELILSIDQEDNKIDENKPNSNLKTSNTIDASKLTILQQKLSEGIEKTKNTGNLGIDSTNATPRKTKPSKNKTPSSSVKKPSNRKRKRKKDSDGSTDDSDFNSDFDDES